MSAADELKRLHGDATKRSVNILQDTQCYLQCQQYLWKHAADFVKLIEAAEVFTSDDGLCLDRVIANANALRLALKPFTEGEK